MRYRKTKPIQVSGLQIDAMKEVIVKKGNTAFQEIRCIICSDLCIDVLFVFQIRIT
jgi:hypothetical protein